MTPHRPDIKGATPIETWHITAECRGGDQAMVAWMRATNELRIAYFALLASCPGDTFSLALYHTPTPRQRRDPDTRTPGQVGVRVLFFAAVLALVTETPRVDRSRPGGRRHHAATPLQTRAAPFNVAGFAPC